MFDSGSTYPPTIMIVLLYTVSYLTYPDTLGLDWTYTPFCVGERSFVKEEPGPRRASCCTLVSAGPERNIHGIIKMQEKRVNVSSRPYDARCPVVSTGGPVRAAEKPRANSRVTVSGVSPFARFSKSTSNALRYSSYWTFEREDTQFVPV